jgi:hypothetical protein
MDETPAGPAPASNRRRTVIMMVATLGAAGIGTGAVLGGGVASGAPPGTSARLGPADNALGANGTGAGYGQAVPSAADVSTALAGYSPASR